MAERKIERERQVENERKSLLSDIGVWFCEYTERFERCTKNENATSMLSRVVAALNCFQTTLIVNEDASFCFRSICGEFIHNRSIEHGPYGHAAND